MNKFSEVYHNPDRAVYTQMRSFRFWEVLVTGNRIFCDFELLNTVF